MKVINIFVEKKRFTQFHGINQMVVGDTLVNILNDFDISIRKGKLDTNIDIFFVGHHDTYNTLSEFSHLLGNRLIYVKQHKKSSKIASLNAVIDDPTYIKGFIDGCFTQNEDWSEYIFPPAIYYVKPEYGARSLNQFIIDSRKVSIGHFLQMIKRFDSDKDAQANYIANLVAKGNGHIKHIKGHERFENEHASINFGYCVHEQIQNVDREYRVINSGFGKSLHFFERVRNEDNDGVISNEIEYVELCAVPNKKICEQLQAAFEKINFFHGSIDLVTTTDGKWSVIETSNQFGGADIPPEHKQDVIAKALHHIIEHAQKV